MRYVLRSVISKVPFYSAALGGNAAGVAFVRDDDCLNLKGPTVSTDVLNVQFLAAFCVVIVSAKFSHDYAFRATTFTVV